MAKRKHLSTLLVEKIKYLEFDIEVYGRFNYKRIVRAYAWGVKNNIYRKVDDETRKKIDEMYEERKDYLEKYFYKRRDGWYDILGGKQVFNRENSDYTIGEINYSYILDLAKDTTISEKSFEVAANLTDDEIRKKYAIPLLRMVSDTDPTSQALKVIFAYYLFWNKSCKNRAEAAERCGTTLERMKEYKKYYKQELYRLHDLLVKYPILRDDLFNAYNVTL